MEFHRIRYFLEVAKTGNFSRAAENCHVSQPSLSQQIIKLENELGDILFKRVRHGVFLTEFGEAFLPHARKIENCVLNAHEFAQTYHRSVKGLIKIGAIPTIAPYLLPTIIESTSVAYPEIHFELHEETTDVLLKKLHAGSIDFALLSPPFEGEGDFEIERLMQDELLITIPVNHPLHSATQIPVTLLESEAMVLLKDSHCLSHQSISICQKSGMNPNIRIQSSQLDTVLALVESGMGVTFTPHMALPFHRSRRVSHHSISPTPFKRNIAIAWPRLQTPSRSQQAFLEVLRKCVKGKEAVA